MTDLGPYFARELVRVGKELQTPARPDLKSRAPLRLQSLYALSKQGPGPQLPFDVGYVITRPAEPHLLLPLATVPPLP